MKIEDILSAEETAALELRALYAENGFSQYKMSKFEPYDLYATNKDFLESERIITFTDISGRLMALKPDVTLSIVKNTDLAPGETKKLYYNETVYRVPKGAPGFRELTQVGLECIGETDENSVTQVIGLACKSLGTISPDCVLDLSHLGLITDTLSAAGLTGDAARQAYVCLTEKNVQGLKALCEKNGADAENTEKLLTLAALYGAPRDVLPKLVDLFGDHAAVKELQNVAQNVDEQCLRIDFSVSADVKYYNGLVFKGYVKGLPAYVLSGGQYDNLMKRMKKNCRALGFAVYMDALQLLRSEGE